jgi:UDP-glucose 4-epimerase
MNKLSLQKSNWLVIGGCGYIGSEVVRQLSNKVGSVSVLDDLSTGFTSRLIGDIKFIEGDASDPYLIHSLCENSEINGVIHCAGRREARESVKSPTKYWFENLSPSLGVIKGLVGTNVDHIIFSSSCSVYGSKKNVDETSDCSPVSPYGFTKLFSEKILIDSFAEQSKKLTILRYFNVVGASGDIHTIDTTKGAILPVFMRSALTNDDITIFGNDFDTPDGTAIRDYVDVRDLAQAHVLAVLNQYSDKSPQVILNVSSGLGVSNLEVASEVLTTTKSKSKIVFKPRDLGDPAEIWGNPSKNLLDWGWKPKFSLTNSIESHHAAIRNIFTNPTPERIIRE